MSVPFQRICAVTVQIGFSSTITDLESSHAFLLVSRVAVEMEAPVAPIAGILWAQVKVPGCAGRERKESTATKDVFECQQKHMSDFRDKRQTTVMNHTQAKVQADSRIW
jgi:hypothetical protein